MLYSDIKKILGEWPIDSFEKKLDFHALFERVSFKEFSYQEKTSLQLILGRFLFFLIV